MNYKLINEEFVDEVNSLVKVYEHIKTKARVLTLSNDDENKCFSIGFTTIPKDSTGVAHIVEHCVLSGSRKYKTKEPFMDMIKSSLQTFLNAMTYPDKTLYPISSRNTKDFYNLMDLYLDSVFFPKMYEEKKIFMQEGWHYELEDEDAPLKINGVVYNEMKGVFSDADDICSYAINEALHENSTYGVISGGEPKHIAQLTYEDFLDFHKKFYHPSNSYIYLYGDLDMDKALDYIDKNYLSNFEYKNIDLGLKLNNSCKRYVEKTYSVGSDSSTENKDYLAMAFCLGESKNTKDLFMRDFLSELLIDSSAAPLKLALKEANFCEDIYAETSTSYNLDLSIIAKNCDSTKRDIFEKIIFDTLKNIVENGIDKNLVKATLNKFEFALREGGGSHRSVIYYIRALNSWLYGTNPIISLKFNHIIKELKDNLDNGYLENYIKEHLLNNEFKTTVSVTPLKNKNEKEEQEFTKKLEDYKNSLTKDEIENLITDTKELFKFQLTKDTKENKDTIPKLDLSDINKEVTHIPCEKYKEDDKTLIFNPQFTNEITYLTFSFSSEHIAETEFFEYSLLGRLLSKVSTDKFSYVELDSEIYKYIGGLRFAPTSYRVFQSEDFKRRFNIDLKCLDTNFKDSLNLLNHIIFNSIYTEKERIKELLIESKLSFESGFLQAGHGLAVNQVKTYFNTFSLYNSKINGIEAYFKLCDFLEDYDNKFDYLSTSLSAIAKKLFTKNNLVINLTCSEDKKEENIRYINEFTKKLPSDKYENVKLKLNPTQKNEGLYLSANVVYVSKGYDLSKLNLKYSGKMTVLGNILSNEYLHNNIRAKGGAYGAGISFSIYGDMTTYSYRDPNLSKTIEVYDNMYKYLDNLSLTEEELTNFIIGSMNFFDPLLTPQDKGALNLNRYFTEFSEQEYSNYKNEAINTSLEDLKAYSKYLKEAMDKNYMCTIGSEEKIKQEKELFNEIINLKR